MDEGNGGEQDGSGYRLPRQVEPRRYQLEIAPDLTGFTFTGRAAVEVTVHAAVQEIVLNAAELQVAGAALVATDGRRIAGSVAHDEEEERAVISLADKAEPGEWTLEMEFTGTINDKLRGLYRSTYRDGAGAERVLATTQFEATDARRAFPCWDEPDRKARFAITLVVPPGATALSNSAEVERTSLPDGRVAVRFADTMPMSTYLVAMVAGPLETTAARDVDGVPLRVAHVPGKDGLTSFALEIGAHALRFFSDWFGIAYPGDKLDLIAIPDFAFGAMENLGAVTFRESLLLVDAEAAAQTELENVADVVAHEIAHMWFGDLVTMRWWNGLWLNEAFATFMEMLCVDSFRPEWDRWVTFGLSRAAALNVDALYTTRPIEFPVARPEEAEGMFDVLTYQKGARVLRMLERYLGPEAFRSGIHRYLVAHSHANAETTDLWDAIEEATGEPVRSTMDSWIFQPGYPVLTVDADPSGVRLSQSRFTLSARPGGGAGEEGRWSVPVLLQASVGGRTSEHRLLLSEASGAVDLGGRPDWVKVNAGGSGFYRVRYSSELMAALTADMSRLDSLETFNLVSDTWAAALADRGPLSDWVAVVSRLSGHEDPAVWRLVLGGLDLLHRVAPAEQRPAVEAAVRRVLRPALDRVGREPVAGEPDKVATLRGVVLGGLATIGADGGTDEYLGSYFRSSHQDRSATPPDLADAVVDAVAFNGGAPEYDQMLERFRNPANPQDEVRHLYALGEFRHLDLVRRSLALSMDEVRTQNAPFLLARLLSNRVGGPEAWEYLKANWEAITDRLPQNSHVRLLSGLVDLIDSDLAADARRFFTDHPLRSGGRTLDQTLERLDVNVAFASRQRDRLAAELG